MAVRGRGRDPAAWRHQPVEPAHRRCWRGVLIDWAQPVRGAAWIDVADLVPHFIIAGHTPAAAEAAIAEVSTWRDTDPEMITSYAAAFAGYCARNSRRPATPGVPHLRAHQARAADAATTWVAHRVSWR